MADELITAEQIAAAAKSPASASSDGNSATARPIDEVIKADQYTKAVAAAGTTRSGWAALRPARVVPPGAGP